MAKKRKRKSRIKSKAQRRKVAELLIQGEIKPEIYERWNRAAGGRELPEHVRKKTAQGKAEIYEATPTAEAMRFESRRVRRRKTCLRTQHSRFFCQLYPRSVAYRLIKPSFSLACRTIQPAGSSGR